MTGRFFCDIMVLVMNILKLIFSRQFFITLLLLGLLAVFAVPLTKNWRQKRAIDREVAELEQQVNDLEHKSSNLKQVLDFMQSDQFVEQEARTKLNYKKPGEEVAVIESRPGENTASPSSSNIFDLPPAPPTERTEARLTGNLGNWLNYFFKK